ncbi:DUF4349 domain-containing protein [Candidatus Microgenomates bacterium]|nr:MAG: DUF4349 domain-containing protein [Candidatus Microgenomates bacterium]
MISWIKNHLITSILLLIVIYLLIIKPMVITPLRSVTGGYGVSTMEMAAPAVDSYSGVSNSSLGLGKSFLPPIAPEAAPQADVANRLVIENSHLSLLVTDVTNVRQQIVDKAKELGGYMVNSNISNPQDAPSSTVTVRVPSNRLDEALTYFRNLSVKVVSENLQGTDVTDQYVDVDAQIANLEKTKARFEAILEQAQEISDITQLNQQIISIQSQIDSYKGQQQSLAQNAQLAKVTVFLSTDEIALPYAPSETFRPGVIFKLAVRSLVATLRQAATIVIWLAVYAVVWVPVLVVAWFIYRKLAGKTQK